MKNIESWKKAYSENTEIRKAMESVTEESEAASSDEAHPMYHFTPPARFMMDLWGIMLYKDEYHILYHLNPTGNDVNWSSCCAHAKTSNLIDWEHMPIAALPEKAANEKRLNDGFMALDSSGNPIIMYTRVYEDGSLPRIHKYMHGDNKLEKWERLNDELTLENHGGPKFKENWSDPYLFECNGRKFMLMSKCVKEDSGEGCLPIYEAVDGTLTKWIYRGEFYNHTGEVVNFAPLADGKWLLIHTPYDNPVWCVGRFDIDNYTFTTEKEDVLSYGFKGTKLEKRECRGFYAATLFDDKEGEHGVFGWISGFRQGIGWEGCASLPRRIIWDGNCIRMTPHPALHELREGKAVSIDKNGKFGGFNGCGEYYFKFDLYKGDEFEVRFSDIENGTEYQVKVSNDKIEAGECNVSSGIDIHGAIDVRIFIDRSVFEIFIDNGRYSISGTSGTFSSDRIEVEPRLNSGKKFESQAWKLRNIQYK